MPHDRDGNLLEIGDFVYIPCIVKSISLTEDYCNLTLETTIPMPPENKYTNTYTLNTKQIIKVNK
jgi:hypothetical protein